MAPYLTLLCLTPLLRIKGHGRPLAACIRGANIPDSKLLKATLEAIVVGRPAPTLEKPQHLCLDKGYDNAPAEAMVTEAGYVPHIRRIGEEKLYNQQEKTHPARRWVMERLWFRCWQELDPNLTF